MGGERQAWTRDEIVMLARELGLAADEVGPQHARWYALEDRLAERDGGAAHQIGGHPDEVQGEMRRACALASKGVYVGEPPQLPADELERLGADAPEWRLLLQLTIADALDWMWGDVGNLSFWMREQDIRAGRWDDAWFQLQCS